MCDNNAKAYTEVLEILKYVIKFHEKVWGEVNWGCFSLFILFKIKN